MKLATLRIDGATTAVRVDDDHGVDLALPDVAAVLARPDWRTWAKEATGREIALPDTAGNGSVSYAPPVLRPAKVLCVGLNYASHILEMGRELPTYPTLFAKFADTLIGAHDDITVPVAGSEAVDWEAELAVVIGTQVRAASVKEAGAAIAGYTVMNDVSMRDWQNRTVEWLQGKAWEATTPIGPVVVTPDELEPEGVEIGADVDGDPVQLSSTADLVFAPDALVSYVSTFTTLRPGDIIATGTPGGVGHARKPPRYLRDGSVVSTWVRGIGATRNRVVVE